MAPRSDQRCELQILDLPAAVDRFGGDRQLLRELAEIFLEDSIPLLRELQSALAEDDRDRTMRYAHNLKGIAANLGGVRVEAAALVVEDAARSGTLELAKPGIEPLTIELTRLIDALRRTVLAEQTTKSE